MSAGNEVWLKVKAYSVDKTLACVSTTKLGSGLVSVPEIEKLAEIKVYPNPSSGLLTIEGRDIMELRLIDLSGRIVKSLNADQLPLVLDLSYLEKGLYYLIAKTSEGYSV